MMHQVMRKGAEAPREVIVVGNNEGQRANTDFVVAYVMDEYRYWREGRPRAQDADFPVDEVVKAALVFGNRVSESLTATMMALRAEQAYSTTKP